MADTNGLFEMIASVRSIHQGMQYGQSPKEQEKEPPEVPERQGVAAFAEIFNDMMGEKTR